MLGLREKNKADKARRLRVAAERLFKERGYEATTMREVAARAKLGLGTVYTYVRDKRALLELMSSEDLGALEQRVFAGLPTELPVREALLRVFEAVYDHHAQDVTMARIIVKELSFGKHEGDAHASQMVGFIGRLAELLARAQERNELGHHFSPMAAAMSVFGLHFFYLVVWLSGATGTEPPLGPFEEALDLQLSGLRRST